MNDEKYVYIQDVKEKKSTARSARNKRTHNGKGGRVKLPSDYMTKKELKAMSGEVKSYRLNEPMPWAEFKAMPDDIRVTYIKLIREKYHAPDSHICKMMGTNTCSFSQEMNRLGIPAPRRHGEKWDKEGFYAWCGGVEVPPHQAIAGCIEMPPSQTITVKLPETLHIGDLSLTRTEAVRPLRGTLDYEGTVEDIFFAVNKIVGNGNIRMTISWEAV